MDALKSELLKRVKHEGPYVKGATKYIMRPYQDEAKENWIRNGHRGFCIMATGTGKTITALYSCRELISDNNIFTIIAVPYKHLVAQWYPEGKSGI